MLLHTGGLPGGSGKALRNAREAGVGAGTAFMLGTADNSGALLVIYTA